MPRNRTGAHYAHVEQTRRSQENRKPQIQRGKPNYGYINLNKSNLSLFQQGLLLFSVANCLGSTAGEMIRPVVHAYHKKNEYTKDEVKTLVKKRWAAETKTPKERASCEKIKDSITETAILPGVLNEHMLETLKYADFKIVCKDFDESYHVNTGANYRADLKTMFFSPNLPPAPSDVIHEMRHAFNHYLHTEGPCKTTQPHSIPLFPITKEELLEAHRTLNLGDSRIDQFRVLSEMKAQGKKLSLEQMRLLATYTDAVQNCLTTVIKKITPAMYQRANEMLKGNPGNAVDTGNDILLKTYISNNQHYAEFKSKSPAAMIIANMKQLHEFLNSKSSSYGSTAEPYGQLAEREAFTLQLLSKKAYETFYPEYKKFSENYINKCRLTEKEKPAMKPEL